MSTITSIEILRTSWFNFLYSLNKYFSLAGVSQSLIKIFTRKTIKFPTYTHHFLFETSHIKGFFLQVCCGNTTMWWWKANPHVAPHILYESVLLLLAAVLFLYVKAGEAGRRGSETLPETQAALISQLCFHFRYRHFALGHAGAFHVMATGLNQKKAYGVITSCLLEVYE